VSSIEHPCILAGGRFDSDQITKFGVHENGIVDLDELVKVLEYHDHAKGAPLVAVMLANNETGVIQPIAEISEIVRANKGYLCVDAVQAFGKLPIDFPGLGAHFVLLSAHKIGGPKGVGAILRMNEAIFPQSLVRGGGQENMMRAGTENVTAIGGFGAAI
jgi:cysteine desulfurase